MTVKPLPLGTHFCWTDHHHFVYDEHWYRVVSIMARGRIFGEFFWIHETEDGKTELVRATILTEAGLTKERPEPDQEVVPVTT